MDGFYWLIPRVLAGSALPGGRNRRRDAAALEDDLRWLKAQGVGALLSMTEDALDAAALERHGFASLHLPVVDLMPPDPAQIAAALAFIDRQRGRDVPVAVHCLMGQGRTGTILAAYLIRDGASPGTALAELRAVCPGAVENPRQEAALAEFATRRGWMV